MKFHLPPKHRYKRTTSKRENYYKQYVLTAFHDLQVYSCIALIMTQITSQIIKIGITETETKKHNQV